MPRQPSERRERGRRFLASIRPSGDVHGQYAGFASRGLGLVIDLVLTTLSSLFVFWLLGAILALLGIQLERCVRLVPLTDFESLIHNLCRIIRAAEYGFSLALPPLYFFLFWLLAGETIGMGIAGVKIVTVNGQPLKAKGALLRLLGYAVSILPLGMGFLWALVDDRRQGWHDKLARTYVVYWRRSRVRPSQQHYVRATAAPTYKPAAAQENPPALPGAPASPNGQTPETLPSPTDEQPTHAALDDR